VKKSDIVSLILADRINFKPRENFISRAFAPSNIALIKYWGKRNQELNLPVTDSLSISLGKLGAEIELSIANSDKDNILVNGELIAAQSEFFSRMAAFVNLFRPNNNWYFSANIKSNIPIGAGLASSACGFASLVKSLDQLFGWQLTLRELSILARLGSGSACRSLSDGFVEWHAGKRADGMDSFAEPLNISWPELKVKILLLDSSKKSISSRVAMQRTVETSILYKNWPKQVANDFSLLRQAILAKDFAVLGQTAEDNSRAMHATMLDAKPAINYCSQATLSAIDKIWRLRAEGLPLYFTQDAGPNLKLIFQQVDADVVAENFEFI